MVDGEETTSIAIGVVHEENGVFGVSFPDFPGCVTGADTFDEAILKADEVLTFHVAGMVEDGEAVPALRTIDEVAKEPAVEKAVLAGAKLLQARFKTV